MGQPARSEESRLDLRPLAFVFQRSFAMALGTHFLSAAAAARTRPHQSLGRSPPLLPLFGEADKLA